MTAERNIGLYRRWLNEIWNDADYAVAEETFANDLMDHTPMQGQPAGRMGDVWRPRDAVRASCGVSSARPDSRRHFR